MSKDHVRQDSSDAGWSGIATGIVGAQDDYMARSGGWPTDERRLRDRALDMIGWNLAVIAGVIALMALLTWLVDH
jgi:hypothetical protein